MKTTSTLILALVLSAFTISAGLATALQCTVEQVEGGKIVLNCGEDVTKIEPGVKVKLKTVKKAAAVEGC